jgi:class 3 adenylate cyclase
MPHSNSLTHAPLPDGTQSRTFVRHFAVPPEAVWPVLSDTARFNEAAKLPKHVIEENAREDGGVDYIGRAKIGPIRLTWDDRPVNWVANRWFRHCRDMRTGPLRFLYVHLSLFPEGEGGCRAEYTVETAPANLLGRVMLATRFFAAVGEMFGKLADDAERFAAGQGQAAFQYRPPPVEPERRQRVEGLVREVEASPHGYGMAKRLADYVLGAQEVDLTSLRPLRLAREWGLPAKQAVELCLESARAGLLTLRWDLLCPRCRVGKASAQALDALPQGAHCGTCNIDYDRDFSRNVEVTFAPSAAVRQIEAGEYCLFGPMSTPHIGLQITLDPGETREVEADLSPGPYRARTLEAGPELDFEITDEGSPVVTIEAESVRVDQPCKLGAITLSNRSDLRRTVIVEELHWVRDALTADRVTAMQAFRDLFSAQVLRPGDQVSVRRITLMFTDLRGSTALYEAIGDAAAYHLVREHFAFLTGIVRANNGAVVKTIGDAIMAVFNDPGEAFRAALDVQLKIEKFNRDNDDGGLVVKLGLHVGSSIAVTLNERLDYFGSTVNMAARLQAQSEGGDIVVSAEAAEDPALRPMLETLVVAEENVLLKGYAQPVRFLRVRP